MATPIYGVAPQTGSGAYGSVPGEPDPTSTAAGAIGGNLSNLSALYQLSLGAGNASAAGQQQQYIQNLPGYTANRTQQSTNIAQELAGQLPQDVIDQIAQQSAQIGAGAGMGPTSPLSNADYLKAIGLTSLGMEQAGGTALNQQIQTTPTGPAFNPSSMLVTPSQEQDAAVQASVNNAMPDPTQAAQANLLAQQQAAQAAQTAAGSNTAGTGGYRITGSNAGAATNPALGTGAKTAAQTGAGAYGATGVPGQTGLGGGTAGTWTPMGNGLQYNSQTGAIMPVGSGVLGGGTNTVDTNPYAGLGVGYDPTTGTFSGGGTQTGGFYAGPNIPDWQRLGFPDQQSYDDFMMGGYVGTSGGASSGSDLSQSEWDYLFGGGG